MEISGNTVFTPVPLPGSGWVKASGRLEGDFLALVAGVVGEADAPRFGALLMSGGHGIAGMELSGHLAKDTWQVSVERSCGC